MSNELKFPAGGRDARDEELSQLLRPLYAPPADEGYWEELHARIVRRVGVAAPAAPAEWWHELNHWRRLGAAAAVMAAALAGAVWMQHSAAQARMAYDAVLSEPAIYSMELAPEEHGVVPANRPLP